MRAIKSGYSVGEYPEASLSKHIDLLTAAEVDGWLRTNRSALAKPGNHIGAWHDTDTGQVWLDIVHVYPNTAAGRIKAVLAGRKHNQIAIFHLDTMQEIDTGGTGEHVDDDEVVVASAETGIVHWSCGRWPHKDSEDLGYNPGQPRDSGGRWTRIGTSVSISRTADSGRARYMRENKLGMSTPPDELAAVEASPAMARQIAAAYDELPLRDDSPEVTRAFTAMRDGVNTQFEYMTGELGIQVIVQDTDPYPDVQAMAADVEQNKTLRVLSSATTGGHPFFSDTENDRFRAVHDFFGHAATGRGFSRHGEEAAYVAHAEMFPPEARGALATETRGQNSVFNFGGTGEFPPQKVALLPSKFWSTATVRRGDGTIEPVVSSLIAACHSRACAPPPVGSGGSVGGAASLLSRKLSSRARTAAARANSSLYPVDTHPVTKASDDHPQAPGADNLEAVRGYRGQSGDQPERRIPRQGETVDIYRDLGRGKEHRRGFPDHDAFSVRLASSTSGNQTTQVVASTVGIELDAPRPSWAHSAKAEAETSGKRGVHGFLRGEVRRYLAPAEAAQAVSEPGWQKVSYYPGTQDFFLPGGRERVVGGDRAVLHQGQFHMLNPQTVAGADPAPVSAIERRMTVTASLLAACHSAACAPPPAGAGGSISQGVVSGAKGVARQGNVPGTTMPYPFSHDADGYQFVGYHLTSNPDFQFDPDAVPEMVDGDMVGTKLFTTFETRTWTKLRRGRYYAAEVWERGHADPRARDGQYHVHEHRVTSSDVKVKKVIDIKEALRNTAEIETESGKIGGSYMVDRLTGVREVSSQRSRRPDRRTVKILVGGAT
jgi:hypothetical protein